MNVKDRVLGASLASAFLFSLVLFVVGQIPMDTFIPSDFVNLPQRNLVSQAIAPTNPISYYSFDDGTALDMTGSNNGTVSGAIPAQGKVGQALLFDGINDKITTGSDFIGTSNITVTAWIYVKGSGRQVIVSNGQFIFAIRTNGTELEYRGANNTLSASAANSIVPNTWIFVTVTRSGENVNFYINGSPSGVANQKNDLPVSGSSVSIGGRATDLFFNGILDEIKIFNRVLDAAEISTLYSGSPASSGSTTPPPPTSGSVSAVNGVYTVNVAGGANAFTTIQACANVVKAGETCLVSAGNYDERVAVSKSGVAGMPIIFAGQTGTKVKGFTITGQKYVVIKNFEMTHVGFAPEPYQIPSVYLVSTQNVHVIDNIIHDTTDACIRMRSTTPTDASSYAWIKGNKISHCGGLSTANPGRGVTIFGNHNLVEENDISHLGVSFTNSFGGDYNVIRNNYFHDNSIDNDWGPNNPYHLDGFAMLPGGSGLGFNHVLIENNYLYNAPDHDSKFVLFQDSGSPGSSEAIVRYNTVKKLGSSFLINDKNTKKVRIYNNTMVDLGISLAPLKYWSTADFLNGSSGGKVLNNIFYNVVRNGGNVYSADTTSISDFYANWNLGYNSECATACTWYNPPKGISAETNGILNKDPLFQNSANNFNLQSNSPAVDRGGPLTKVSSQDSGSGANLIVEDGGFFQDGWAGISPDWIAVGGGSTGVPISDINYTTNTITLSYSIPRKAGDPVYLYKKSDGGQVLYGIAPDIGSHESIYSSGVTTPTIQGDFYKDGQINSLDVSMMASAWNTNNSTYDLTKDGIVNTLDFSIVVQNWTR